MSPGAPMRKIGDEDVERVVQMTSGIWSCRYLLEYLRGLAEKAGFISRSPGPSGKVSGLQPHRSARPSASSDPFWWRKKVRDIVRRA